MSRFTDFLTSSFLALRAYSFDSGVKWVTNKLKSLKVQKRIKDEGWSTNLQTDIGACTVDFVTESYFC